MNEPLPPTPAARLRSPSWSASLLAETPAAQRAGVLSLALETEALLRAWVSAHPAMPASRATATALTLAVAAPTGAARALAVAGQLILWIFAVDDLFDDGSCVTDEVESRLVAIASSLEDERALPDDSVDPLRRALHAIVATLSTAPLHAALREPLRASLVAMLGSMAQENRWRDAYRRSGRRSLPTCDAYLEHGVSSIGMRPLYRVLAIMLGNASTPGDWPRLQGIEGEAALAVRLANDLRSYERELREQAINAVLILAGPPDEGGLPAAAAVTRARAEVQARLERALQRCAALCRPAPDMSTRVEDVFLRYARVTGALYRVRDFADPG